MKMVKCIAEKPVNIPVPGGRIDFYPDEEKEIPDEIADKLDKKHFKVEGVIETQISETQTNYEDVPRRKAKKKIEVE
jgi:hypothetical protein